MNTQLLNKKSLHCRLATRYGKLSEWELDHSMNVCDYTQHVLKGVFAVIVISAFGGFTVGCIADTILWVVMSIVAGQWLVVNEPFGIIGLALLGVPLIIFPAVYGLLSWQEYRSSRENTTSFLSVAYQSFKDKVCFKVKFK